MRNFLIMIAVLISGCGYSFQNSHNPLAEKEGIYKIYIAPLVNNTYKPGVENVVYNAVMQTIAVHRRVRIVSSPEQADAVLHGFVNVANYVSDSSTPETATSLPANLAAESVLVATEYVATLSCSFALERSGFIPGKKKVVWTSGFNRSEPFGASNNLGVQGTTSALINESEFDRALNDLAQNMSQDVHESMLAMF